jgi:hypothetical protein
MASLFLQYVPLLELVVLLGVLIKQRSFKGFPWFFIYVAFAVGADTARLAANLTHNYNQYFYTYWTTEAGYALLGTLVLYEVFNVIFKNLTRTWWMRVLFVVTVVIAVVTNAARNTTIRANFTDQLIGWILVGESSIRFLQVLFFVLLCALVPLIGLRWRRQAFGIAAGFGLFATIALASTLKISHFVTRFTFVWGVTTLVGYSIAVLIWLFFFLRFDDSGTQRKGSPSDSGQMMEEMRLYREFIRRIGRQ